MEGFKPTTELTKVSKLSSEIKFNFNEYMSGPNQPNPTNDMSQWIPYLKGDLDGKYKLSRHHIIPKGKLDLIKIYECKNNANSQFCKALLANGVQEWCGFNKPVIKVEAKNDKSSKAFKKLKVDGLQNEIKFPVQNSDENDEECNEDDTFSKAGEPPFFKKVKIEEQPKKSALEKHPHFVWETGNLFYGPNRDYRTDDTNCNLDTKVLPLMDCLFSANMPGTRLKLAYEALTEYNKSIIGQNCSSESEKVDCIKAAGELNVFYQNFCSVKDNPLYDSSFYLKNFWKLFGLYDTKAKFSLKTTFDCDPIRLDVQNAQPEDLREENTFFLQKDAVVSDHFHKTETVDSSNSRF